MNTRKKNINVYNRILAGALVAALLIMLIFTSMGSTMANQPIDENNGTILYLEQADHIYEIMAELGTAMEDLGLPTEMHAIVIAGGNETTGGAPFVPPGETTGGAPFIPPGETTDETTSDITDVTTDEISDEIADEPVVDITDEPTGETIDEPAGDNTSEPAGEPTNELADESANEPAGEPANDASDEPASETITEPAGETVYQEVMPNTAAANMFLSVANIISSIGNTRRIAANEIETIETEAGQSAPEENNGIGTAAIDVPVTWEGYYNAEEYGVYTLTARIIGYTYDGAMPVAIITIRSPGEGTASISGFFWVDGNGDLDTDWDGLFNGAEAPLAGFRLYLYAADDLSTALATTLTNVDGIYSFNNLEPGTYVLGLWGAQVDNIDYLAPIFVTSENKFAIDWSVSGLPAYTEAIELEDGQAVDSINAAMRLPMGVMPLMNWSNLTGLNSSSLQPNDVFQIDGWAWVVVRKETVQTADGPIQAVYLIMRGARNSNMLFGPNNKYAESALRNRLNAFYVEDYSYGLYTIRKMALIPDLGDHSSQTAITKPTGVMAGSQTVDILFAPSLKDMENWVGGTTVPSSHPLGTSPYGGAPPFPERFWFRTPSSYSTVEMTGHLRSTPGFDHGININGSNLISDVPGVWVNGGAAGRNITIHYIDIHGNVIKPPYTDPRFVGLDQTYPVPYDLPVTIPVIDDYIYTEWRKDINGAPQSKTTPPNLLAVDVRDGKDLYLVYERTTPYMTDVTVSKEVVGEYGSKAKLFEFTVYFADSSGTPLAANTKYDYVGGLIDGASGVHPPQDGELTLDGGGKASFLLRHGQKITIQDVPEDVKIKVLEKSENKYWIEYRDSKTGAKYEFDASTIGYDDVGAVPRTFEFFNVYLGGPPIVPTGIDIDAGMLVVLSVATVVLIGASVAVLELIKRRTSRRAPSPDKEMKEPVFRNPHRNAYGASRIVQK